MKDVRLVVCDIDGTLMDESEELDGIIYGEIEKLKRKGIAFSLATGRNRSHAMVVAKALDISVPFVVSNGACLFLREKCIKKYCMPIRPLRQVLDTAADMGFEVTVAEDYALWEYPNSAPGPDLFNEKRLLDLDSLTATTDSFQKVLMFGRRKAQNIDALMKMIQAVSFDYSINHFPNQAIEIGPSGCSKASGVADLGGMLDIPMANIMVCGDSVNDREMVQEAGIGIAVGNASEEIKQIADYAAAGNNIYGVIEAIQKYCL